MSEFVIENNVFDAEISLIIFSSFHLDSSDINITISNSRFVNNNF